MPVKYARLIGPRRNHRGTGGRALIRSNPVGLKSANGWKWIQIWLDLSSSGTYEISNHGRHGYKDPELHSILRGGCFPSIRSPDLSEWEQRPRTQVISEKTAAASPYLAGSDRRPRNIRALRRWRKSQPARGPSFLKITGRYFYTIEALRDYYQPLPPHADFQLFLVHDTGSLLRFPKR